MQCLKEFTIRVNNVLFSWGVALLNPGAAGSATFSPDNADGNSAAAAANTLGGVDSCSSDNTGSIVWNSNDIVPANMHIVTASTGANPDPDLTASISVFVVAPFSSLLLVQAGAEIGYNAAADFPFNLPDTGGADWTINWAQSAVVSSNPANPGSMSITGALTLT